MTPNCSNTRPRFDFAPSGVGASFTGRRRKPDHGAVTSMRIALEQRAILPHLRPWASRSPNRPSGKNWPTLPEDKFEIRVAHAKAQVEGMTTSAPNDSNAEYTGENEWFTPAEYVEKARETLGRIDLDPASHVLAQKTVRATAFYTAAENGLTQPWSGRVWLNPPYSRELMSPFVDKFLSEYARGAIEQAILLTHDYTDTGWFHAAARAARAICLARTRIHFLAPSGEECSPRRGQTFFYFGRDDGAFRRAFSDIGLIMRPA